MWRKGNASALLVGMQTGAATVESSMEIPQKIKYGSAFQPSDPTSGNISEGSQNTNLKEHKHPMFIAVLFTVTKIWKQPESPSVGKNPRYFNAMDFYLAIKKEGNLTLWSRMDDPREYYAKRNKPVRERQLLTI